MFIQAWSDEESDVDEDTGGESEESSAICSDRVYINQNSSTVNDADIANLLSNCNNSTSTSGVPHSSASYRDKRREPLHNIRPSVGP